MCSNILRISRVFCSLSFLSLLWNCAEPRPPQGGPADSRAPKLHSKRYSTPNKSTNYKENQVILTFDEWIKLQAAQSQLVVSPPLVNKPTLKIRNKSLVLKWKDRLKDSTTYTIGFGDAVRDITENNSVKNLKFVFSTGPFLDSLSCKGRVVDAKDGTAVEDVLVMLYKDLADSVPLSQNPYYFSETAADGTFNIDNIGEGAYKVFALKDMNSDYLYNLPNERIAFLDSTFVLNDSLKGYFRLRLFQERSAPFVLNAKKVGLSSIRLQFNRPLMGRTSLQMLGDNHSIIAIEQGNDTLRLWLNKAEIAQENWQIILTNQAENWTDTVVVDALPVFDNTIRWCYRKKWYDDSNTFEGYRSNIDTSLVSVNPFSPVEINFNHPIDQIDLDKWHLYADSSLLTRQYVVTSTMDSVNNVFLIDSSLETIVVDTFFEINIDSIVLGTPCITALQLYAQLTENKQYKLLLLDSAVQDVFGKHNQGTFEAAYLLSNKDQYGRIDCLIRQADSSKQYLAQLVDKEGQVVYENILKDSSSYSLMYPFVNVGNYTIAVIEDSNRNACWDPGLYQLKRQAEIKTISNNIALKPGWENFMEIDLSAQ